MSYEYYIAIHVHLILYFMYSRFQFLVSSNISVRTKYPVIICFLLLITLWPWKAQCGMISKVFPRYKKDLETFHRQNHATKE